MKETECGKPLQASHSAQVCSCFWHPGVDVWVRTVQSVTKINSLMAQWKHLLKSFPSCVLDLLLFFPSCYCFFELYTHSQMKMSFPISALVIKYEMNVKRLTLERVNVPLSLLEGPWHFTATLMAVWHDKGISFESPPELYLRSLTFSSRSH